MSGHHTDRTPVVLVHSSGLGPRQWRRVADELAAHRPVHVPALSGYSGLPWAGIEGFDWRQDLQLVLDVLPEGAHVVGHSYGGFLALQAARVRPVASLALWEPVAFPLLGGDLARRQAAFLDREDGVEGWLQRFLAFWNGPGAWEAMGDHQRAPFLAHADKVWCEVRACAQATTTLEEYAAITCPTLFLAGEQTRPEALAVNELLAGALPEASQQVVEGCGHMGPVLRGRRFAEILAGWLGDAVDASD